MGERSSIEWTDHTFNPWWGCQRVSPACQHCYAEAFAKRTGHDVWGGANSDRRFFGDAHWREPLRWDDRAAKAGRPALVFCASMADVFEDRRDLDEHRARLWELVAETPNLIWLLLTKRPECVLELVPDGWRRSTSLVAGNMTVHHPSRWPGNVWLGTTVEDQRRSDERIPHLVEIPAPVRFLSCEPLLGPVDLGVWLHVDGACSLECTWCATPPIGWVIAGGESGNGARPMHPDWARSLRDQTAAADVPFLFKQWGDWIPYEPDPQPPFWDSQHGDMIDGHTLPADLSDGGIHRGWTADIGDVDDGPAVWNRVGKKSAGRLLDQVEHTAFPPEAQRA